MQPTAGADRGPGGDMVVPQVNVACVYYEVETNFYQIFNTFFLQIFIDTSHECEDVFTQHYPNSMTCYVCVL